MYIFTFSQDAPEVVMLITHSLTHYCFRDFTDVSLVSEYTDDPNDHHDRVDTVDHDDHNEIYLVIKVIWWERTLFS